MNGGLTECNECDCDPCICVSMAEREQQRKISEGKVALEVAWDVFNKCPKGWKQKLIKWLWPDLTRMATAILDYYWDEQI